MKYSATTADDRSAAADDNDRPLALQMEDISKRFPGVQALDAVRLAVEPGEVHGLVGENGAGKSTLIKILAGVYQHDGGSISVAGDVLDPVTPQIVHDHGVRFIHQELHLVPHFTVAESVFMGHELSGKSGLRKRTMRVAAEQFLHDVLGAELDGRALVRDLGPAEHKLIQIARALVDEGGRLVVFDEPTAPLASAEVGRVFTAIRRLQDQGIAILYVSHYLGEIAELCDRVTVLRNGSDVGVIDRFDEATRGELIRLMVGREIEQLFPERQSSRGEPVLAATGLGDGAHFSDVTFEVGRGEIVGVAGLLGSGREELIDALVGLRPLRTGSMEIDQTGAQVGSPADALQHGAVLVPRDRRHDGLVLDMTVADNVNLATLPAVSRHGWILTGAAADQADRMVNRLDVRPANTDAIVRLLSGGNQQKVVLGRWLAADADLFILDEPTVGVDIGAKAEIYRLIADLAARGMGVLISSNDQSELVGMCDRVIVLVRGRVVASRSTDDLTQDDLIALTTGSADEQRTT